MRRLSTLLSFGLAAAAMVAGSVSCNAPVDDGDGPISDWPPKAGSGGSGAPINTVGGGIGGGAVADAGVIQPGGTGGSVPGIGGAVGGTGGITAGGTTGGAPTSSADAGTATPSLDAGTADGGFDGSPIIDGGGAVGEGGCSAVPDDAGVVPGADGGVCAAYGCGVTLDSLSAATRMGACTAPEALPFVCSGELARAALLCTQENALGLGLGRPVSTCMRRLPQFAHVSGECQQCYADETLCTLSKCFVACIDGSDPACQQCRQQNCGAIFSSCAGVPYAQQMPKP